MSAGDAIRFIKKDGRVIPITAAAGGAGRVAQAAGKAIKTARVANAGAMVARHGLTGEQHNKIVVNKKLDALGLGLSVASGVVAAATFSGGAKGLLAGSVLSHALDAGGVAANVGSVAGKGNGKERAKTAAKNEARNFAIGNLIFAAGIVGVKANRQAAVKYAEAGAKHLGNVLALAKKAFGAG